MCQCGLVERAETEACFICIVHHFLTWCHFHLNSTTCENRATGCSQSAVIWSFRLQLLLQEATRKRSLTTLHIACLRCKYLRFNKHIKSSSTIYTNAHHIRLHPRVSLFLSMPCIPPAKNLIHGQISFHPLAQSFLSAFLL